MKVWFGCGLVPVCVWRKSRERWKKRVKKLEEQVRLWSTAAGGSVEANGQVASVAWLVVRDLKKELAQARRTIEMLDEQLRERRGIMALEEQLDSREAPRKGGAE